MARPLRIEYDGALYHVTARGNERKSIFFTKTDFNKFLHYISEAQKKLGIKILCYVLMSNHYHLILETPGGNLCKAMHYINGSYTRYINAKRNRSGHLFQGRYKAILVDKDNYLLELSRYIHLNPVRAGIVEKPEEYPHSSYKEYITNNENRLAMHEQVLELISNQKSIAKEKYKGFVEAAIGNDPDNPFENVYGGIMLGDTRFIKDILHRIKTDLMQKKEISYTNALKSEYCIEEILNKISATYNIKTEEIITNKYKRIKKLFIYVVKTNSGAANREIGKLLGGMNHSAISKIYMRFKKEVGKSRQLRDEVSNIERKLSNVEN